MTNYTSLYKLIETLYSNYNGKSMLPDWFSVNLKTLLSKNITIEDWNSLQLNVKNVVGESSALYSFCNSLTPVIKELINSTAHSIKFNGNVLYLLDANGEIIASEVLQIPYDMELSADSTNAVQNKVIKKALDKKLDKVTNEDSRIRVYGISPAGSQKVIPTDAFPHAGYVAMYGTEGQLSSEEPTETYHVANKQYVDKVRENIELKSDVVDVVHNYADLEYYDTSTLTTDDIIKVLQDETHNNASSYYRWNTTFEYVGSEGPYYTQTQADEKLDKKLDKVAKTDSWQVYGEGTDGTKLPYNNGRTIKTSEKPEKYTLMHRGENGNCQVENPIRDKDIANKVYVDNKANGKVDKVTTTGDNRVYAVNNNGEQYMIATATYLGGEGLADYIPRYDENGFLFSPSIPQNYAGLGYILPNKIYVDSKLDKKLDKVTKKTNRWQLYGVGATSLDMPNDGKTVNADESAVPYTIINRSATGTAEINDPVRALDMANKQYVDNSLKNYTPLSSYNESLTDIANNKTDVANIKKVIPSQANENNQLADKNFVNSTINSNTAFFIGNFNTYADLETWQNQNPSKATNNDYAYINSDENHNGEAWKYQYVKKDNEVVGIWKAQFKINDSPFTAEQLAAINSGVTKEIIDDLNAKEVPTDINVDSDHKLILERNGVEIAGQKKQVLIPPFALEPSGYYNLKTGFEVNHLISESVSALNELIVGSPEDKLYVQQAMDYTNSTFEIRGIKLNDGGSPTFSFYKFRIGEGFGGTVATTEDVNDVIKIFDFTSLDFTNVLSTLSDEGYVSIDITDEAMKNDLKTIFDRLQNNKTSFIEFPQLQSGGSDAEIQKTRMFALIQNSIYLGTGVYGLYGLMYFYRSSDMLIKIRIDTNFDSYYGIVLENVENKFVNKSSVKKIVYATNSEGAQINLPYALNPGNSNLAQFDTDGHLYTNTPSVDLHATNKKYVEDNFEKKTILSNVLPTNNILLDLHNYQLESPITSDFSFIMPANASDEYLSEISFTTGPTLVAFTTTSAITFTGEDCSNTHTFVPDTNKHYNIIFWKDKGGFQAVVRGY